MSAARGRPSDYCQTLVDASYNYLENCPDKIPSVEGLCEAIGISRPTAYLWAKDETKEFSYILELLMQKQAKLLLNNGLDGVFNPSITKLMLTKHGYSDKVETEMSGSIGLHDMTDEQLNQKLAAMAAKIKP